MKRNRVLLLFSVLAVLLLGAATGAPIATVGASAVAPNDATQARLRVTQCVLGGPTIDVYVNSQVAVNAGVPMTGFGPLDWSGYLYLAPGTYRVALVPTGQRLDQAFLGPLDVTVVAGHRYALAALGQADEPSHPPLLIDETAAYQAAGRAPTATVNSWINNIRGVADLHFISGGHDVGGASYGGFQVATYGPGPYQGLAIKAGDQVMDSADVEFYQTPAVDQFDCFGGSFPGQWSTHTAQYNTALNSVAFLQAETAVAPQTNGQIPSFSTFLAALQTTGLTDLLANGGPYMIFPPTDAAFAALPPDQRAALLADPHALATMLRSLIVPGYYPPWNLGGGQYHANSTVTNLLGQPLALHHIPEGFNGDDKFALNGAEVGGDGYIMTANGSRVFIDITQVWLPASSPGMPTTGGRTGGADALLGIGTALLVLVAGGLLRRRAAQR